MSLKNLNPVQCPNCNAEIGFLRVKPRFNCLGCGKPLESNRSSVDVWAVLIYAILVPVVWIAGHRMLGIVDVFSYWHWGVFSASIAIALYCLLAPRALHITVTA